MAKKTRAEIVKQHNMDMTRQFTPQQIAKAVFEAHIQYHGGEDETDTDALDVAADTLGRLGIRNSMVVPTADVKADIPENDV